jgi:hypothetical protein
VLYSNESLSTCIFSLLLEYERDSSDTYEPIFALCKILLTVVLKLILLFILPSDFVAVALVNHLFLGRSITFLLKCRAKSSIYQGKKRHQPSSCNCRANFVTIFPVYCSLENVKYYALVQTVCKTNSPSMVCTKLQTNLVKSYKCVFFALVKGSHLSTTNSHVVYSARIH